jgi:tetratricopeptide (TPR) repeat protein
MKDNDNDKTIEYNKLIGKAYKALELKQYKESVDIYSAAFKLNGWKINETDDYNMACAWAKLGNTDSAFAHLERASLSYYNLDHLPNDEDLTSLQTDNRWKQIVSKVSANKTTHFQKYEHVIENIDKAFAQDQFLRNIMTEQIGPKYGYKSTSADSANLAIATIDSINTIILTRIINEFGWVGKTEVGALPNYKLSIIMQHAAPDTMRKYLPLMRNAFKHGNMSGRHIALIEDRVKMFNNEKQIYGTQVRLNTETNKWELYPIEDEENVNKRRAIVGLNPIEEYLKNFGIIYTAPKK